MIINPYLLNRRTFLVAGGLGWCRTGLSQGAGQDAPSRRSPAKSTILIWLNGGASHIDTWDMKPDAPAEVRGPFQPMATSAPGIRLCEHLPLLARQAHQLAIVRSVDASVATNDHHAGYYYNLTGHVPEANFPNSRQSQPSDWPFFGAVVAAKRPPHPSLPSQISINRQYVSRAINLGLTAGQVLNVETPILFQDERRKYVVMGLGKDAALAPSDKDLRLRSDSAEADNHSQPHERRNSPVKPIQRFSAPERDAETTNGNGTSNGQHQPKVGFNALLEEAQSIQNGLRDLLLRTNQLLVGLKAYRRHAKTMQSTLASLRQLQQVEA